MTEVRIHGRVYLYDVTPEEVAKDDAVERLAGIFYDQMTRVDSGFDDDEPVFWDKLPDENKAFWISAMQTTFDFGEADIRTALGLPPKA